MKKLLLAVALLSVSGAIVANPEGKAKCEAALAKFPREARMERLQVIKDAREAGDINEEEEKDLCTCDGESCHCN